MQESNQPIKMNLPKPFFWIRDESLKPSFIFFMIMAVLVMIAMKITGTPLETEVSPLGILDFEFAWNVETAKAMMDSWELKNPGYGKIYAAYNMGLDSLYLFVYSHAIGLACLLVGRKMKAWYRIGLFLAGLQIVAALFDLVENYGLIKLIQGSEAEIYAQLAYVCAIPKFIFVLSGLIFSIIGAVRKA